MSVFPCLVRIASLVAFCLALLGPSSARAVNVTVGGTTYDILFLSNVSFNANDAVLESTPWWGTDHLTAQDFANAYNTQVGVNFDLTGSVDMLYFIYSDAGATQVAGARILDTGVCCGVTTTANNSPSPSVHFAYVAAPAGPAAVPEIDGNALAKALFILFALGAWLHTRRAKNKITATG
ncbi:MAG: hypothetical protein ACE368_18290 [Paracoccaceae bacterium]